MIRIIGILTGSALAVAFLIVALGIPELEAPQPEPAAPTPAVRQADAAPNPQPAPQPQPAPNPQPSPQPQPQAISQPEPEPAVARIPPSPPVPRPETAAVLEDVAVPVEEQWYAFWSPFRSKVAADGFVSQLQKTTGLDYRVVKLEPGVYEVAFAYSDDSDIQEKLVRISSATGLDLPGG